MCIFELRQSAVDATWLRLMLIATLWKWKYNEQLFTARWYCYSKSSVRDVDVPWSYMSWVSLKVITRLISLGSSLLAAPTTAIVQGEHPKNSGGIGVRLHAVLRRKPAISLKRGKIGPRLLLMSWLIGSCIYALLIGPKSTTLDDLKRLLRTVKNMRLLALIAKFEWR